MGLTPPARRMRAPRWIRLRSWPAAGGISEIDIPRMGHDKPTAVGRVSAAQVPETASFMAACGGFI